MYGDSVQESAPIATVTGGSKGGTRMGASGWAQQGHRRIGRECRERMLARIGAHEGVMITDEQARRCSTKAYRLTYRCYLAAGAGEKAARAAAVSLALETVAYLAGPPGAGPAKD